MLYSLKVLLFIVLVMIFAIPAEAARKKGNPASYDFTKSSRYAGLVVNADTSEIIYQRNANKVLHPASLTKMMTAYIIFTEISEGNLSFEQRLPVSEKAASMPRTNMRLTAGSTITVKEAILGLLVHSANDAAVVLAEAVSGSEAAFADKMTSMAKMLGMSKTIFKNAHGLPHPEQVTSAADMAKLAIALRRDHEQYYHLLSTKSFSFKGTIINSHNHVMRRYPWADGGKTGFIHASGFNLVTSANKLDTRLVGVVMGGHTAYARDTHMIKLLEHGYGIIQNSSLGKAVQPHVETASAKVADIPYKEGAFEVAFNDAEKEEFKANDDGEVLGNLVDKGLSSTQQKLDVKPLKSQKKIVIPSNKVKKDIILVRKKRSGNSKVAQSKKYNKIVVVKKSGDAGAKKSSKVQAARKYKSGSARKSVAYIQSNSSVG